MGFNVNVMAYLLLPAELTSTKTTITYENFMCSSVINDSTRLEFNKNIMAMQPESNPGIIPDSQGFRLKALLQSGENSQRDKEIEFSSINTNLECGAYVSPNEWKVFSCYNLGSANTSADPFSPSWEINGGYWQWGRKEMAAPGPNSNDFANADGFVSWNTIDAPKDAWLDSVKTANDPCPNGYRVPSESEWSGVLSNNQLIYIGENWNNSPTNYGTGIKIGKKLFLPAAGKRSYYSGILNFRGDIGFYWSSTADAYENAGNIFFQNGFAHNNSSFGSYRPSGLSIRCISE